MSFNHRLEGNNPHELESCQLADAVHAMTSRAESVICLIEGEFQHNKRNRLNDELISESLQSVLMEVLDVRQTVENFHSFQVEKGKKENQK